MNNTRGQSMLAVLIASALIGVVFSALVHMQVFGFKASSHTQLRGDITNLQSTLRQQVDCNQTFTGINIATACTNSSLSTPPPPTPLVLKDFNGNPITGALQPVVGTFNPTDTTFQGSGQLGVWSLRAYCDVAIPSLIIRSAQPGGFGGFAADALTKQPMNWVSKSANPVFGDVSSKLCVAQVGGSPVSPTVRYSDLVKNPAAPCDPALWGYNTVSAGPAIPTLPTGVNSITTWSGDASCPVGFFATGGGGNCSGGSTLGGTTTYSRPTFDASGNPTGWHLDCCIASAQPPATPESLPNDVSVLCVRPN